ncbi:MAG: cytochrome c oxidase assembly protein [Pseudomonadota bacterium]
MATADTNATKIALRLVGVVVFMVGMAFAAVPLYDLFCRVTGYGGTTQTDAAPSDVVLDRTVTVRFDASTMSGMPWEFKPMQRQAELRIGETGLAFYEAHNPTARPVTGTASFNVTPFSAGPYFVKMECFCFTETTLQPGERMTMPVSYYIDPELVDDAEAGRIHTITLSYTFFETEPSEASLGLPTERTGG